MLRYYLKVSWRSLLNEVPVILSEVKDLALLLTSSFTHLLFRGSATIQKYNSASPREQNFEFCTKMTKSLCKKSSKVRFSLT